MLSALLAVQYANCSPNVNDKACAFDSTGLHSTSAGALGTISPHTTARFRSSAAQSFETHTKPPATQAIRPNARNQAAAVDIKHIYRDNYGKEDTKTELRVTLRNGEETWVYFWTSFNSYANPRTLYIRFDGERVLASMARHSAFYNSVLVTTSRKWSCLNWSLKKGQRVWRADFSTYSYYRRSSGFKYYRDMVDIRVLPDNIPLGPSKDLECFDKQFPSLKTSSKNRLRVNLTKMYYKQIGMSKWCCKDVKEESTVIDLTEGQTKTASLKYVSITDTIATSQQREAMKRRFKDENPRNLTMMFSNGILYVGMAKLKEKAYHTGKQWMYDSSWECINVTMATKTGNTDTGSRLNYFSYYSNAGPVTTIEKRTDYVLLEVLKSHAGVLSSYVAVVISALFAVLGNSLNI